VRPANDTDTTNFKISLRFNFRRTYAQHTSTIFALICLSGDDLSKDMWNKLTNTLPFREQCAKELALEEELKEHILAYSNCKSSRQHPLDYNSISIHRTANKLSEIQQSTYIFYTTAVELSKLECYAEAACLLKINILSKKCTDSRFKHMADILNIQISAK